MYTSDASDFAKKADLAKSEVDKIKINKVV